MRRLLLAGLLALAPLSPATAGQGACVSTGGVTACPTAVNRCSVNDTIRVTVYGAGQGTASCGGATASCFSVRVTCTDDARATSSGALTCSATGSAVAICAVVIAAN